MIDTHSVYYPLYTDIEKPIILITGGRGSGKSFGCSTFIERLTFEVSHRDGANGERERLVHNILFSRYTMASAEVSVIPEFLEKVQADGTEAYFHATKQDVVNLRTGSKVMFRGIKTSSGNQTAKLKSIHGITTFVCDEGEEWQSEEEFKTIMYSIRQKGIQNRIIIIMNPTDKHHFVYRNYIQDTHKMVLYDGVPVQISTHPSVLHIHTTYLDNIDNLSEEFIRNAQYAKEHHPEEYAHTFMGHWTDEAEGVIYDNWDIVDEFPEGSKHQAVGLDFGFTHDQTAAVRCGLIGDDIYVDELFYRTGMLSSDISHELHTAAGGLMIVADSADPRLIQEIANAGLLIYPVQKGAGSIEAGIDKLKTMRIHVTSRSKNLITELKNYTWSKDKDGRYINVPIDAYNHALDALRYYVLGKLLGRIMRTMRITADDVPF
ncbi:MAG: PBSX family phage terminase large subunit [Bacteroidales bacterium]|nr:PBSX family phage terminase large subunit [Bacteroidales bacterium]